jgi:diguanylate cyclase (GGDEF)-like protein
MKLTVRSRATATVRALRESLASAPEREVAAVLIGAIALAGSIVGLVTMLLPHPEGTHYLEPAIAFVISIAAGTALIVFRERVRWGAIAVTVALGSIVVTVVMLSVPDRTGAYASYYVWLGIFAFYFLRPPLALAQVGLIGVLYAGAVAVDDPPGAFEQWVNGFVTTLGVGLLVLVLRTRIDALVARLRTTAATDDLTGLPNRRAFDRHLAESLDSSVASGREVSLALVDLDGFKALNDTIGHLAGDEALRRLGVLVPASVRAGDWPARFGGDEFAVILADTSGDTAAAIAERLRAAVERSFREGPAPITVSVGVATGALGTTSDALLSGADAALYRAKRAGGNRVESVGAGPAPAADRTTHSTA